MVLGYHAGLARPAGRKNVEDRGGRTAPPPASVRLPSSALAPSPDLPHLFLRSWPRHFEQSRERERERTIASKR